MLRFLSDAYSPRALVQGHYHLLATSTMLTRDPFMLISISYSLLFALGTYEVMAGHVRAALMGFVASVLGPVLVTAGLGVLVASGSFWAEGRLGTLDIGASAIIAAASGGVAGLARNRLFTIGLVVFLGIGGLLIHHRIADWEHVMIFPVGYLMGRYLKRSRPRDEARRWPVRRIGVYVAGGAALLAVGLTGCSWLLPSAPVQRGANGTALSVPRVIDTNYSSPALGGARRRVVLLLPAGYDSSPQQRYPVIELLHGHPGRPDDFFALGDLQHLITSSGIGPFIAVMPDGNGPKHDDSWWANIPGQQMGTAASTDVRAWVTKSYRTNSSWSYAGLSSGGYGAAYLPLIDKQPIHGECGLSGYYDSSRAPLPLGSSATARRAVSPIDHSNRAPSVVFLAYGRSDLRTERQTVKYAAALRRAHREIVRSYPGRHYWNVWRPALRDCFRQLVPSQGNH